jgi:hypothetical protein
MGVEAQALGGMDQQVLQVGDLGVLAAEQCSAKDRDEG